MWINILIAILSLLVIFIIVCIGFTISAIKNNKK